MLYIIYTDVTPHTILHTLLTCSLKHVHRQENWESLAVSGCALASKTKETSTQLAYIATVRIRMKTVNVHFVNGYYVTNVYKRNTGMGRNFHFICTVVHSTTERIFSFLLT
jgi:hypothetical protein